MPVLPEMSACCGCGTCASICPNKCIEMKSNDGFLFPAVDVNRCVNCGLCNQACPVIQPAKFRKNDVPISAYAAVNIDDTVRMKSSSGGVFSALATTVLRMGGTVFGAAYDEVFDVRHIGIENEVQIHELTGSKYVQSQLGTTYCQAKKLLQSGKIVLYSGTPCQINGLYKFLGHEYTNLYTVDVACHGVPSPEVWRKYKASLEEKTGSRINSVNFRDKVSGWRRFSFSAEFENGMRYCVKNPKDKYFSVFLNNYDLRDSCYECRFRHGIVSADITIADFWGIWNMKLEGIDDLGTSLLLINTRQGRMLADKASGFLRLIEVQPEKACSYNAALLSSPTRPPQRDSFMRSIEQIPIEIAMENALNSGKIGIIQRAKSKLWYLVKHH